MVLRYQGEEDLLTGMIPIVYTVGDSVLSFQYLCGFAELTRLRVPSRARRKRIFRKEYPFLSSA